MNQIWYVRGESRFSDHRPVQSLFSVQLGDHDNHHHRPTTIRTANIVSNTGNNSSSSAIAGNAGTAMFLSNGINATTGNKVQLEEMLLVARTQSCLQASRF
jgi:hypothetical protein